jgi:uncharacterized membrane protein YfcA
VPSRRLDCRGRQEKLNLSAWDYLVAAAAGAAAGGVNALAGGGTLISFPALVAVGVSPVPANVTNTVSLVPGYLSGSWAQRDDLRPELAGAKVLALVAAAGGLAGSVLLLAIPSSAFRAAVPYLIVLSCVLLMVQDRLRAALVKRGATIKGEGDESSFSNELSPLLLSAIFLAAVYGGFFGAGLSIMVLAVLGIFSYRPLNKLNALKQALSFVINMVAAVFFAFSGKVVWSLAAVMAVTSLLGGYGGGRVATRIDALLLRRIVVVFGVAVAISFWAT